MTAVIRSLGPSEPLPVDLLLEADPSEELVRAYAASGMVRILELEGTAAGVCVLAVLTEETAEIKNIAVAAEHRGKGLAKLLIADALEQARNSGCRSVEIGTGNSSLSQLALYQKCGFRMKEIDRDFFIRHYPEPIFENGIQCRDMVRLEYMFDPVSA